MRILVTNDDGIHSPGLTVAENIARSLSDTFAGIAPASVPAFIGAQLAGALAAAGLAGWLFKPTASGS